MQKVSGGFTLFELLVVLALIGLMAGLSMSAMPRLLSGQSVQANARRLAGAGLEARQRALLEQRPWELIVDVLEGTYYIGPQGAFDRREQRLAPLMPSVAVPKPSAELRAADANNPSADALAAAREKVSSGFSLKDNTKWRAEMAYSEAEDDISLVQTWLDDGIQVVRVAQGQTLMGNDRPRLVFSARGFSAPYTLWLHDENSKDENEKYTVFFPGLLPPEVVRDFREPQDNGMLGTATTANQGWSTP